MTTTLLKTYLCLAAHLNIWTWNHSLWAVVFSMIFNLQENNRYGLKGRAKDLVTLNELKTNLPEMFSLIKNEGKQKTAPSINQREVLVVPLTVKFQELFCRNFFNLTFRSLLSGTPSLFPELYSYNKISHPWFAYRVTSYTTRRIVSGRIAHRSSNYCTLVSIRTEN